MSCRQEAAVALQHAGGPANELECLRLDWQQAACTLLKYQQSCRSFPPDLKSAPPEVEKRYSVKHVEASAMFLRGPSVYQRLEMSAKIIQVK